MPEKKNIGRDLPDECNDAMAVVPGYEGMFAEKKGLSELLELIGQYPAAQWLCYLSRLQTLVAPPRHFDLEAQRALVGGIFSDRMRQKLDAYTKRFDKRVRIFACVEPQIATLQQLAVLHAPESAEKMFLSPENYDDIVTALLITWDLMFPQHESKSKGDVLATVIQQHALVPRESAFELVARAVFLYGLHDIASSSSVNEFRDLFRETTGADLVDYVIGGMATAVREYAKSSTELADVWLATPFPDQCQNPAEARCLRAFHEIRCGAIDRVRDAIVACGDHERDVCDFSLIGLQKYPIIELPKLGRFVTNLSSLSSSIMGGIRFAMLDAILESRVTGWTPQRLNGLWGTLFEEYVLGILSETFGDRFVRLEQEADTKRADCLVIYPGRVLVIEIKGSHVRGRDHRRALSLEERVEELKALQVPGAARQLAATIRDMRGPGLNANALPGYDWTTTTIVPIIITYEQLPQIWELGRIYEQLTEPLNQLPLRGQIAPVRILSVDDVEGLPDLAEAEDVGAIFNKWAYDRKTNERPLSSYVRSQNVRCGDRNKHARLRASTMYLTSTIGLDASPVFEGDQSTST